jgi:hypothetical protein
VVGLRREKAAIEKAYAALSQEADFVKEKAFAEADQLGVDYGLRAEAEKELKALQMATIQQKT